ncbi:MAG TPA: 3-dehydroquinate synthase [Pyrinomonadaceae bacterium]|jgi:3-dehydroquinate synthase
MNVRFKAREQSCEISVGAGILRDLGAEARRILDHSARKLVIISNQKVFGLYGGMVSRSLRDGDFGVSHWLMSDGERYKSLRTLEQALAFLSEVNLERSDAVLALGGGVVSDLAGLASALHLRGIALLQVPTTLLAQIDASIGGKTGINTAGGKNQIGAFHQPRAVWIDTMTLKTLPRRELTAGWCEAVKQGAAGSRALFRGTYQFLQGCSAEIHQSEPSEKLIAAQCAFKASIVARDQREDVNRSDRHSRRILNFGHTTAHALEAITSYRRFRHGEAVGYGMIIAGEISQRLGLLPSSELKLLRDAVRLCGRLPRADNLDSGSIIRAIAHDKKLVGGELQWVLLNRIGQARIVPGKEITTRLLRASLHAGLRQIN